MRNLIDFLIRNSSWFVFIFLEIVCFYFVFNNNSYQKSVFLNSSNEVTGQIYSISGGVVSYFGLKSQNQELLEQNAELHSQIILLKERLNSVVGDTLEADVFLKDPHSVKSDYRFITAQVINNSVSQTHNYITINKGISDSVKIDMGVVSQQGLVGIVRAVSRNFAVVQPILNPNTRISTKTFGSNAAGTLTWDGVDSRYAYLDYPRYEKFERGDTIVTSGFSDFFPEGIMVGIVEDYESQNNDNFFSLKVKLATDFATLKDVILIEDRMKAEKIKLEKEVRNVKK
jgi:rod shape-determining protein MreC